MFSKLHQNKILSIITACCCMSLVLTSCEDEEIGGMFSDGRIAFQISNEWGEGSRSNDVCSNDSAQNSDSKQIPLTVGGCELNMTIESVESVMSRGAMLDNVNNPISTIYATAIKEDGKSALFSNLKVDVNNNVGATKYYWPMGSLSFMGFAWSKKDLQLTLPTFERVDGVYKSSFSYTIPENSTSPRCDATNQPDIVLAISADQSKEISPVVNFKFHHALSALMFKVGRLPENVFLNSISISGVYDSGTCTATATDNQEVDFAWDFTGKQQKYTYVEDLNQEAAEGDQMGTSETIFMMLPQTMGENTKLILSFSIDGTECSLEKNLADYLTAWEADKKYLFTIGIPDEVGVEVTDLVDGVVKSNVTIQNTGVAAGYIRVAIVGYWMGNNGIVAAPWKEDEGEFAWGSNWDSHWKKGSDGFYYHLTPVKGGEFTHPLFDTYTLKASTAQGSTHAYHTLELSIVTQIIPETEKSIWTALTDK
ncbi:MAG: fimbrillin family protein [Muribaculaceae bacterium]|nr:fimbrillin family protein [Muribaculaceae bacterium]